MCLSPSGCCEVHVCQRAAVVSVSMAILFNCSLSSLPWAWTDSWVFSLHTFTTPLASPLASSWGLEGGKGTAAFASHVQQNTVYFWWTMCIPFRVVLNTVNGPLVRTCIEFDRWFQVTDLGNKITSIIIHTHTRYM